MKLEFFERELRLATQALEPDKIQILLRQVASQELDAAIQRGEANNNYDRFETPTSIVYVFNWWTTIIPAAISELQKRSPVRSGRYRSSFVAAVNSRVVSDYESIPGDAEVIITNFQPYTRKIEASRRRGKKVFDGAKSALKRKYGGSFTVETMFLNIASGVHSMMPYILKHSHGRPDRQAGMPITYPSLVINQK